MWITRPYPTKNAYLSIQMSASCRFSFSETVAKPRYVQLKSVFPASSSLPSLGGTSIHGKISTGSFPGDSSQGSACRKMECEGLPSPDKTLAFCQKRTSTFFDRKMRPRPRLRFWPTQRPCFRVLSSCTLYEVFGNFAWRSAPPRKRVAQLEKAPDCETERCPLVRGVVGPACGGTAIGEPA